jgi:hypothetical protein
MLLRALFNESTSGIVSRYASSIVVSKRMGSLIVWSLDQPFNRFHILPCLENCSREGPPLI